MRPVKIKDRCTKKKLCKSKNVVKLYDEIQIKFADMLDKDNLISEINCNVPLQDFVEGSFSSDFVCIKKDGDYMVRECVFSKKLSLPRTEKLLDASRTYWNKRGVTDWGIVINKVDKNED